MTKFTKKQRHELYKAALERIVTRKNNYGCDALHEVANDSTQETILYAEIITVFPEFRRCKPIDRKHFQSWWPDGDVSARIDAFEKCIRQTRPIPIIDPIVETIKKLFR